MGEQELGRPPGLRVLQRPPGRAGAGDAVDQGDGVVVEGDHALAVELAERDFQPGAGAGDLVDAVEFEVAQFADADPGGAGKQERAGEQPVRGGFQCLADEPVGVGGQVAGQRPREFRDVAGEHEPAGGRVGPFPFGDVGEEPAEGDDPVPLLAGADGLPAAERGGDGGRGEVGLDVMLPVQPGEGVQAGVDGGEMPAEVASRIAMPSIVEGSCVPEIADV